MEYIELSESPDQVIARQDLKTRQAHAVIIELLSRNGFDHWFENLDDDIQNDIFDCLRDVIYAEAIKAQSLPTP